MSKYIFLLFLQFSLAFSGYCQPDDKLESVAPKSWVNSTDSTFSIFTFDEANNLIKENQFFLDSSIKEIGAYNIENGLRQGKWRKFYPNGFIKEECTYRNDTISGLYTRYYHNHQIESTGNYYRGKKDGMWTWYYNSGRKKFQANSSLGEMNGMAISWFSNGVKESEGLYKNGKPNGKWKYWDQNGNLIMAISTLNGLNHGEYIEYYPNGKKHIEGVYQNGTKRGLFKYYNNDGTLLKEE